MEKKWFNKKDGLAFPFYFPAKQDGLCQKFPQIYDAIYKVEPRGANKKHNLPIK